MYAVYDFDGSESGPVPPSDDDDSLEELLIGHERPILKDAPRQRGEGRVVIMVFIYPSAHEIPHFQVEVRDLFCPPLEDVMEVRDQEHVEHNCWIIWGSRHIGLLPAILDQPVGEALAGEDSAGLHQQVVLRHYLLIEGVAAEAIAAVSLEALIAHCLLVGQGCLA